MACSSSPTKPERGRLFPALSDEIARSWTSGPCCCLKSDPSIASPMGLGEMVALNQPCRAVSPGLQAAAITNGYRGVGFGSIAPRSRPRRQWRRGPPRRTLLIIHYSPPVRSRCPAPPMGGDEERQTGPVSSTECSRIDLRFRCKGMSWKSNNSAKISSPACLGNTYMPTRCRGLACTR